MGLIPFLAVVQVDDDPNDSAQDGCEDFCTRKSSHDRG